MNTDNLRPLTDEDRIKGQHTRSERKTNANRIKAITNGKHITHPALLEKSLLQIKLEQAFHREGVHNPTQLAEHLLKSLALTAEQLNEDVTFQNAGAYTRLVLDVFRACKEDNRSTISKGESLIIRFVFEFMRREGEDELLRRMIEEMRQEPWYAELKRETEVQQ